MSRRHLRRRRPSSCTSTAPWSSTSGRQPHRRPRVDTRDRHRRHRLRPAATGALGSTAVVAEAAVCRPGAHRRRDRQPVPGRHRRRQAAPARSSIIDPDTGEPDLGATRHRGRTRRRRPRRKPGHNRPGASTPAPPKTPAAGTTKPTSNTSSSTTRNPGRFDVPPRKWTRVPFNTVRIQRTLGTRPSTATVDDAWLARRPRPHRTRQKRGAARHPRHDVRQRRQERLRLVLDRIPDAQLTWAPDYTGGVVVAPDRYTRAARMTNTTNGQVLRWQVEPNMRAVLRLAVLRRRRRRRRPHLLRQSDNPYPALPALARPAAEQTLAVPETHQRRLARQLPDPGRQPRLRPRLHGLSNVNLAAGDAHQPAGMAGHALAAPVRHRQIPALHTATTTSSSGGNAPPSSSTTTTTPTPSTTTPGRCSNGRPGRRDRPARTSAAASAPTRSAKTTKSSSCPSTCSTWAATSSRRCWSSSRNPAGSGCR